MKKRPRPKGYKEMQPTHWPHPEQKPGGPSRAGDKLKDSARAPKPRRQT